MDIVKIGSLHPSNYTTKGKKFEDSLYDYILIATKLVNKFCTKDLSKEILNDEDATSSMAHSIMMADWRWKKDYKNQYNTTRTQYSYRTQCFLWAVKGYIRRKGGVGRQKIKKSLNYAVDNQQLYSRIVDKASIDPVEAAIKEEEHEIMFNNLHKILTDKESVCVTLYYIEKYTYKEIGKRFGLCKERIRQIIHLEAFPKLYKYYKEYYE